jgi:hypothetical protein
MNGSTLALTEMLLVLGGVLGFGFWELWKLKRDKHSTPPLGRHPGEGRDPAADA